jgi:hypothetical protein
MNDSELDRWRTEWAAQPPARNTSTAEVRAAAIRQQRRLRASYLSSLLAAMLLLSFSAVAIRREPSLESWLWAATVWITTLLATAFSIWNWRGLWKANVRSVADFARAYEARSLAMLRGVRFGYAFLALQSVISFPWLAWDLVTRQITPARFAISLSILVCLVAGFAVWFRASRRRALGELEQVRASL